MRTTLNLPDELLESTQRRLGFLSKTDTVIFALNELQRKQDLKNLVDAFGKIEIDLDLDRVRDRPNKDLTTANKQSINKRKSKKGIKRSC
jgi:hypothetical protein